MRPLGGGGGGGAILQLLVALLFFLQFPAVHTKIISCGGYIKSSVPIDLSTVQVRLLTVQGHLKHESECNPTSGYYMVPIYKEGKYQLKVSTSDGVFTPEHYDIEIASTADSAPDDDSPCKEDINFTLYGFTISGAVKNGGDSSAQMATIKLNLHKAGGGDQKTLVAETTTKEDGSYEFVAQPGKYIISSASADQCVDRKVQVEVTASKVVVKPDLRVTGHTLTIGVKDLSGASLPGATLKLTSTNKLPLPQASEAQDGSKWAYTLSTQEATTTSLPCLPPGQYSLKPEWQKGGTSLNFKPTPLTIGGKAEEAVLQPSGFDIVGRVGAAIGGVEIAVEGAGATSSSSTTTTTNEKGEFTLSALQQGAYKITATKQNYAFSPLSVTFSSTGVPSVPLVVDVSGMAVCGSVSFSQPAAATESVELQISEANGGGTAVVVDKWIVGGGSEKAEFCRTLPPGKYKLSMAKTPLSFTPQSIPIDLTSAPQLNLLFTQFKASISGRVERFDTCSSCQSFTVQLLSDDSVQQQEKVGSGTFQFEDVPPGKYAVRVVDSNGLVWWEQEQQRVEVVDSDVRNVVFRQTGFKVEVTSTHSLQLEYFLAGGGAEKKVVQLQEGSANRLHFPKAGTYQLRVVDSCHQFFEQEGSEKLVLPSVGHLDLKAKRTFTSASIVTDKPSKGEKFSLSVRKSTSPDSTSIPTTSTLTGNNNHTFVFYLDRSDVGSQFVLTPSSEKYLFLPPTAVYTFSEGECKSNVAVFKAGLGMTIRGTIKPAVAGATVTATNKEDLSDVLKAESDAKGAFSLGPVWRVEAYEVEVKKEGYQFNRDPQGGISTPILTFQSLRLSQLRITFRDERTKQALPDVLVSLSGATTQYRSNSVVDGTGIISFIGLPPGDYFLRPILQEYKFNSAQSSIHVKEGELQELTWEGTRFAYSVFGGVTIIGGGGLGPKLRVEAVSAMCDNHQEEDVVDPKSLTYRVRGLKPECNYQVSLKEADASSHDGVSAYPPFFNVLTKNADRHGVDFTLVQVEKKVTLMGRVVFEEGVKPPAEPYRISLFANNGETVLQETTVNGPLVSVFTFDLTSLSETERRNLSVGLKQSEARKHKLEAAQVDCGGGGGTPNRPFTYVKLPVRAERKSAEVEVSKANYFGLFLTFLLTAAFFTKKERLIGIGQMVIGQVQALLAKPQGGGPADDAAAQKRRAPKKH